MQIKQDDLSGPEIQTLLRGHLADAYKNSPPDSVHALGLSALQKPGITFWSVWGGRALLGCGALKELDKTHGEIKSMRTASAHLGKGVGSLVLRHLLKEAARRGYQRLSLETGNNKPYAPARALYTKFGFHVCGPFAQYGLDPFSVYMTKNLTG